jgi:hypothetical protein
MLDKEQLQYYYDKMRDASDKIEIFKIFREIYRKGHVAGCSDANKED